ncbi:DUF397 domain-containing protein [Streptomyces sp. NPDC002490]|uniref:DUF397 domain-containing protein n=1 Tax=Streptomyces sp. NPDC002490 TaxID=3154416 RepID=UPI003327E8F9
MAKTDSSPLRWIKSSYSTANGGSCVEWAPDAVVTGTVPVRDSKDLTGPVLSFPTTAFSSFVSGVKGGDFGTV